MDTASTFVRTGVARTCATQIKPLFLTLAFALFSFLSFAQPVSIVVDPAFTTRNVGQTFTVLVNANFTGATAPLGIDDIEIHLAFDNTKLQVTAMSEEPVVAAFTAKPIPLEGAPFTATNTAGQINYHATTGAAFPTTDFPVLSITFTVIGGAGTTSDLLLRTDPPTNETRAARSGSSILESVINGSATINAIGCTPPTATIATQVGANFCDGQSFDLILASTPAPTGVAPFDLTIAGPNGTATYNDIPVGGVITSFTPASEKIWPADPFPLPPANIDASVTLGVKFQSSVSGFVRGVRFFSPTDVSLVAGNYTGQLWTTGGILLASGTFTGLAADSWQELIFDQPVLIDANTTYVASYHTIADTYVSTATGLAAGVTTGSLTALSDAVAGGNGVYTYGATPNYPASSFNATNYWVDVIFSPNVYTFNLTGVKDANECSDNGALQTLTVTSVDCSTLPVNLVVTPPTTTTAVGQTFNVLVSADFIGTSPPGGIDDVEVHLAFDNTKLQVTAMTEDPVVAAFTAKPIPLEAGPFTATNTAGQVNYRATTTTGMPTADFNILSITFTVISGEGTTTPLTLRLDPPTDESRVAGTGISLLATVAGGTVTINAADCVPPEVTIASAGGSVTTCDGQSFDLVLATAPVGTAPFDLTIAGPGGTATYNDIPVGGVITTFTAPVEKLWPSTLPPLPTTSIDQPLTVGLKFRSTVSGFIKGVRFFSPDEVSAIPGDYTGQLWSESGTLLASGVFTGVTPDSWQELTFTTPVLIDANTTYIASYHTNADRYVGTADGLLSAFTNGSLTALASAAAGGNGVYTYGASVAFPVTSIGANYWVDVIFSPNVYAFNLTGVTDADDCSNVGALQTLNITSVDCSVLPVTLLNFSATPKDQSVFLKWSTASENNNRGFEIERSINGTNWSVIGFVNGAGNSGFETRYNYTDAGLAAGKYMYRLKQIDIDNRFAYSSIVSAVIGAGIQFTLDQNFPNPFSNETVIRFSLPQTSRVNLSVFDMYGRLVRLVVNESRDAGTHAVNVHTGTLSPGLYYYKLQAGNFSAVRKMTIQ